ncbi:acetyl-CoA carboxylase carboxyltransferase subunit alpha [Ktedonosporobacter rubrisoli]|uniref:Acetyl-coenzyme A carboxylase carboxyl transferase subunit alpha n=1 Tax=Ktedonosporobacter rubrisoli TaxID=2509675 RepID=A0A4P6JIH5_KTERU|nr:acetyl-CoA carboxylase carboxyltransferase subunit alpha [Ktedonosporobacter rubrisoli]QBD74783.1 acetyl-CoA carboxylase carboxyltransferase subunit alpha [Ktedonosporobacter rubrisoli]
MAYDLPFEKPLADLEARIAKLKRKGERLKADERAQLQQAEQELQQLTQEIYGKLSAWQTVMVARHKDRPHAIDYLNLICDAFFELHGDRRAADNPTIVGGPANFGGRTVMFIGQEKGRGLKDQRLRHAGQTHPEGHRKAYRLMQQAEKFHFPIVYLIDTPGASIALEDEERGQATSVAENLYLMASLKVPTISVIIGEGGSGGALALGIADRVLMQAYSYYTVASPESAATIMWRDAKYAPEAAEAMQITARQVKTHGLIDDIIAEPAGGAHKDHQAAALLLKEKLLVHLQALCQLSLDELLVQRYSKLRSVGRFAEPGIAS